MNTQINEDKTLVISFNDGFSLGYKDDKSQEIFSEALHCRTMTNFLSSPLRQKKQNMSFYLGI